MLGRLPDRLDPFLKNVKRNSNWNPVGPLDVLVHAPELIHRAEGRQWLNVILTPAVLIVHYKYRIRTVKRAIKGLAPNKILPVFWQ